MSNEPEGLNVEARMEGETDKAYTAYCIYRDLPPQQRSLRQVSDLLGYEISDEMRKKGNVGTSISRWSQKFCWRQRAAIFDAQQDCQRQAEQVMIRRRILEIRLRLLEQFKDKMIRRIEQIDADALKPIEAVRLLDIAFKIEDRTFACIEKIQQPFDAGRLFADFEMLIKACESETETSVAQDEIVAGDQDATSTASQATEDAPSATTKTEANSEKQAQPTSNPPQTNTNGAAKRPRQLRGRGKKLRRSQRIGTEHLSICPAVE